MVVRVRLAVNFSIQRPTPKSKLVIVYVQVDRGEVIVIGEDNRLEELERVLSQIRAVDASVKIVGKFHEM